MLAAREGDDGRGLDAFGAEGVDGDDSAMVGYGHDAAQPASIWSARYGVA